MLVERESNSTVPEGVNVIPTQPEIPKHIEARDGVQVISQPVTPQFVATNDPSSQKQDDAQVVIVLPSDPQTLQNQFKNGNAKDALTWLSAFWLRMLKKAVRFGWKVEQK